MMGSPRVPAVGASSELSGQRGIEAPDHDGVLRVHAVLRLGQYSRLPVGVRLWKRPWSMQMDTHAHPWGAHGLYISQHAWCACLAEDVRLRRLHDAVGGLLTALRRQTVEEDGLILARGRHEGLVDLVREIDGRVG